MNGKAIGDTIQEVASSIANSNWGRKVIPTIDELNQTVAKNVSSSERYLDAQAQRGSKAVLQLNDVPQEEIGIVNKITAKNLDKDIESLKEPLAKLLPDENIDEIIKAMKESSLESIKKEPTTADVLGQMNKPFEKYLHYPKAYFTNPDKEIQKTRAITAGVAYAGIAVGGRYLSGGTLTTDSYGRKDIAGIPLL